MAIEVDSVEVCGDELLEVLVVHIVFLGEDLCDFLVGVFQVVDVVVWVSVGWADGFLIAVPV